MKKTYITPALVVGGRVVDGTLSGFQAGNEIAQPGVKRSTGPGSLGFYL